MFGRVSEEMKMKVPAAKAWELYGTLEIANLVAKHFFDSIHVVQGDGGVGTVLHLNFKPGLFPFSWLKEKFTKVDDENMVKEVEVVEGGFLDFGFSLYRIRIELKEDPSPNPDLDPPCTITNTTASSSSSSSCTVRTTIEYEIKEDAIDSASSLVSIQSLVAIMNLAKDHLHQLHIASN